MPLCGRICWLDFMKSKKAGKRQLSGNMDQDLLPFQLLPFQLLIAGRTAYAWAGLPCTNSLDWVDRRAGFVPLTVISKGPWMGPDLCWVLRGCKTETQSSKQSSGPQLGRWMSQVWIPTLPHSSSRLWASYLTSPCLISLVSKIEKRANRPQRAVCWWRRLIRSGPDLRAPYTCHLCVPHPPLLRTSWPPLISTGAIAQGNVFKPPYFFLWQHRIFKNQPYVKI